MYIFQSPKQPTNQATNQPPSQPANQPQILSNGIRSSPTDNYVPWFWTTNTNGLPQQMCWYIQQRLLPPEEKNMVTVVIEQNHWISSGYSI